MSQQPAFDFQSPLKGLHSDLQKTPQQWFDDYAAWLAKTPSQTIPFINDLSNFTTDATASMSGRLVRFRGMISNQLNPEYFHSQFVTNKHKDDKRVHSGLYCNFVKLDQDETILFDDPKTQTMVRYPMLLLSPPNQTTWMRSQTSNHVKSGTSEDQKNDPQDGKNAQNAENTKDAASASANAADGPLGQAENEAVNSSKLVAKFYSHETALKVCDLVDVYGIWYPPEGTQNGSESKQDARDAQELEFELHSDLASIHVLYWKSVENGFNNEVPCRGDNLSATEFNSILEELGRDTSEIRESLIKFIASYFGGDELVAQYVLLNMISKVEARRDGILLGYLSLSLTGFDTMCPHTNEAVQKINELYSLLLPYVMQIDVTVEGMNRGRLVPCKNHDTNELELHEKNSLQVLNGTSLIVNQIPLKPGNLDDTGVKNCNALAELIEKQVVNYDFKWSQMKFDTDCSVLVLSEKKPLRQLECLASIQVMHCKGGIREEESGAERGFGPVLKVSEAQLQLWRKYICVARMLLESFSLPENVCKLVEEDFVQLRKEKKDTIEDDLHYRLTLLRLVNASFLKQETDEAMLKEMQRLEKERSKRTQMK